MPRRGAALEPHYSAASSVIGLYIAFGLFIAALVTGVLSGAHTLARTFSLAVDILTFSLFSRKFGITISSWCGLQIRAGAQGSRFGRALGWVLNHIQYRHCERAIQDDIRRANSAIDYLTVTHQQDH